MDRHGVGHQLHMGETSLLHHGLQLLRGAQPPCPHGQQVKMEVGIDRGFGLTGFFVGLGHGLGQQQDAADRQSGMGFLKNLPHHHIGVVVRHTHQGDQVSPFGQWVVQKAAGVQAHALGQAAGLGVFVVQTLLLRHAPEHPQLLISSTARALDAIAAASLLDPDDAAVLREAYALRSKQARQQKLKEIYAKVAAECIPADAPSGYANQVNDFVFALESRMVRNSSRSRSPPPRCGSRSSDTSPS